ncbi:hypothetical protein [Bacillus phage phiAGATE]|uniref:Uncharacterized protein n=1 Tax=Bacillus phage phiAGATE TaxID=1204533 RepID=L0L9B0_9CAUD|nr:hypothetical protein G380_gp098 [Bacillus phage phiAGATE]AGB62748.1 hypothetical protein [Bacillus phage phiAGATE]
MEAKLSGSNIVIKLPVDEVVGVFEVTSSKGEAQMRVKFKRKFAESVVKSLQEISSNQLATNLFTEHVLDNIFDELVENQDKSIKYPDEFKW